MPFSSFENLGLTFDSEEVIHEFINFALEEAEVVPAPNTEEEFEYRVYRDNKLEVWFFITDNELVHIKPFFEGKNFHQLGITNYFIDQEDTSGRFFGFIEPNEELTDGLAPVVFEVPDFWLNAPKQLPSLDKTLLTAFAINLEVFEDEQALEQANTLDEFAFSSEMFIPIGLFGDPDNPEPLAQFSGEIIEVNKHTNKYSGKEFYHLVVKSLKPFDVVSTAEAFERQPKPGNYVKGDFMMSGRLFNV